MGFPGATDVLQRCDPGASLGGHRLVARLSRGRRSTSYLTLSEDDQPGLLRVFHGLAGRSVLAQTLTAAGGLRHGGPLPRLSEDGGEVFALDDLLIGESLASALQRIVDADMPMPPAVAVSIGLAVIAQLRQAERSHGDLVPAHILLGFDGEVWVIDPAGLEASARRALPSRASYLPPELGPAAPSTSSSDLYQLAGALFEALTARALAPDAPAADVTHLPRALHRVLHRMLRTHPEARFADLGEVAEALQRCLGDTPVGPEVIAAWTRTFFADRLGRWRGFVQLGSQRPSEAQRAVTQINPLALEPLEAVDGQTSVTSADLTAEGLLPERTPPKLEVPLRSSPMTPLLAQIEGDDTTAVLQTAAWSSPDAGNVAGSDQGALRQDISATPDRDRPRRASVGAADPLDVTYDAGADWLAGAPPPVHPSTDAPKAGLFRPLSVAGGDWSTVPWSALLTEPTTDGMPDALVPSQTPLEALPAASLTPVDSFSPPPSASADMAEEPELPHPVGRCHEWETLQRPEDVLLAQQPSVEEVTQARHSQGTGDQARPLPPEEVTQARHSQGTDDPTPTEEVPQARNIPADEDPTPTEEVPQARPSQGVGDPLPPEAPPQARPSLSAGDQALLSPPSTVSSPALPGVAMIDGDFAQANIETQVVRMRRPPEQLRLDRRPPPRLDSLQLDISVGPPEDTATHAPLGELGAPLSTPLAVEATEQLPLSQTDPAAEPSVEDALPDNDPPTLPASVSTFEIEELPAAEPPARGRGLILLLIGLAALVAGGWAAFQSGHLTPLLRQLGLD